MKSLLSQLRLWIKGAKLYGEVAFNGVSIDSRNIAAGQLFVAVRGEQFDGHDFIEEVIARGAVAVMVEHLTPTITVPAMVVPDTRAALGDMAHYWRHQFSMPVIGVTGSNGKTTVKEMIAAILGEAYGEAYALATRGNLNNEIGVPLTLMRMDATHQAAVIELGMNHPGEITRLAIMAEPTVGLINNAQREHQEFMESVEAVARENGAVLTHLPLDGVAVFPADDVFSDLWRSMATQNGHRKIMTFGFSADADVRCQYQFNGSGYEITVLVGEQKLNLHLSVVGVHNVRNALAAIACTLAIGVDPKAVVRGLAAFVPVKGRLQRKVAENQAQIIDDTYNANPDSVRAAIDVLAQTASPRILVLGDMGEVGREGIHYHEEVGSYARDRGVDYLFAIGDLTRHTCRTFGERAMHYTDIVVLNQAVKDVASAQATVLIKGSRFMKMERVVQNLVEQTT